MSISVAIEGNEGGGKTLLHGLVANVLIENARYPVLATREPGGTPLGEWCRNTLKTDNFKDMDPMSSVFLFSVGRNELYVKKERPFLKEHDWGILIKDRSRLSTAVLQVAEGADPVFISTILKPFEDIPDKFLIIDIPIEETIVRMEAARRYFLNREIDWKDEQTREMLFNYRRLYLDFVEKNTDKCFLLDCFNTPWENAATVAVGLLAEIRHQQNEVFPESELQEIHKTFSETSRLQLVNNGDFQHLLEGANEVRLEFGFKDPEELRAEMHAEWKRRGIDRLTLGVEGCSSGGLERKG